MEYMKRRFDYERLMEVIKAMLDGSEKNVADVFGPPEDWSRGWADEEEAVELDDQDDPVRRPYEYQGDDTVTEVVEEVVDLPAAKAYLPCEEESHREQAEQYVAKVEAEGRHVSGTNFWALRQTYKRKVIAGVPSGRLYGPWLSLQWLSKGFCGAACGSFGADLDFENSFYYMLAFLDDGVLIGLYKQWSEQWRNVVAAYYGISLQEAKLLMILA